MKNILTILIILTFVSCKENTKEKSFHLSGTINGEYTGYIFLNYGTIKDSVKVSNNSFEFNGSVKRPIQGWLNLKSNGNAAWLYIENSHISIKTDYERKNQNGKTINFLNITDIKGSYSAKIQNEYKDFYQANKNKENFKDTLYNKLNVFIEENKNHPISGTILGELALIEPILTRNELIELYSKIDTTQQSQDDLKMFKMGIENLNEYGVNKPFLEFTLPNTEGKNVDIKSFLGKKILVDFWASWCIPCRKKHPELIKLKNKLGKENFDIVSVSIDDNKENWLQAIEKDSLKWTNLIDIDKQVNNKLGIQAIPYNYLIDENGIVLGVNLSIDEIEKTIGEK
ncbi:redoxin family protein [Tenacibaculum amylolyticum]|uniref:redoxin family protein n=1 Tax=Tenacibaculum amylolyticum TaxID=104269 RepID=UPI0038954933